MRKIFLIMLRKKSLDFLIPTSGRKISAEIDVAEANMAKEFQAVGILGGKEQALWCSNLSENA